MASSDSGQMGRGALCRHGTWDLCRECLWAEIDLQRRALRMACEAGGSDPTAAMKLYVNAAANAVAAKSRGQKP